MAAAPDFRFLEPPSGGIVDARDGKLVVPDDPIIPVIVGDGTGADIMRAALPVLDAAVDAAYQGIRRIHWFDVPAGEVAHKQNNDYLPPDTLEALRYYKVSLKGPLTTPIGKGIRSLNVMLRKVLDLYACVRPVYWIQGVPSPIKRPQDVDLVIFRENTEDVYAGIEWTWDSAEAAKMRAFLKEEMKVTVREDAGIGLKPISKFGTQRLLRKAVQYAIDRKRRSVTIVHKGNIMKFTEGAFRDWGYELARTEFGRETVTEDEVAETHHGEVPAGKVVINDRIADNMLQQLTTRTADYDVLALPNLNGDYISDAAAGLIGGLGMAPGANLSDSIALFEATHGSAPKYAGLDKVNPSSVILSGAFMLEHMGWADAAALVKNGIREAVRGRTVTYDLARQMEPPAVPVKASEFGAAVQKHIRALAK